MGAFSHFPLKISGGRLLFSARRGKITLTEKFIYPPVAKLDIAADSDSEGRGFESLRAGQNPGCTLCAIWIFSLSAGGIRTLRGRRASKKAPGAPFFASRGAGRYHTRSVGWPSRADAQQLHPSGRATSEQSSLCSDLFLSATKNKPSARSLAPPFRKKSRSAHLFSQKVTLGSPVRL